ncbi:hypothetical protein BDZ90DRAFT_280730 [Jaminaea rosea]|uniref:Uncharacterized protein n=1 Tax=Jaminaea rosea TaxID=1569628 RepID=A0A316UST5_9BASI|nr:hypothetical protein BDZ90DRAFT_280730 [Jaminaea rosea]PWN26195.1 hypothetical protein BDZ90DRAFT_280730 [Jaminaea rosea]
MSSTTNSSSVAGHPIAIRAGGRRISQSHTRRASQGASTSPTDDDANKDASIPLSTSAASSDGYPRPEPGHGHTESEPGKDSEKQQDQQRDQGKKKKKGIKSDEAKMLALNNAGSASSRAPRHAAGGGNMDARIKQPASAMGI